MAWLKGGDNLSTHPKMSQLLEATDYDHQVKNEAFGLLVVLSTVSAAHLTDYVVEPGLIAQFAPGREKPLIEVLVKAGLIERLRIDDRWMYKIFEDEEFLHMRSREEVTLDRLRKSDMRRPELMIPVRVRDGDQCRWCGRTVSWADRKSSRSATIDSLTGHKDSTVEDLVVACRGCNSKRHDGHDDMTLRPAPSPEEVYYTKSTRAYINNSDFAKDNGIHLTERQLKLSIDDQAAATTRSDDQAAAIQAAPAAGTATRHAAPAHDDPLAGAPDWVTMSIEEIRQRDQAAAIKAAPEQAAATTRSDDQAAAIQAAPAADTATRHAAPDTEADTSESPPITECNETIKPRPDPGHEGDGPGSAGTGRDGSGQAQVWPGRSTPRRKRGRRSGRKKRIDG